MAGWKPFPTSADILHGLNQIPMDDIIINVPQGFDALIYLPRPTHTHRGKGHGTLRAPVFVIMISISKYSCELKDRPERENSLFSSLIP